MRDDSVTAYPEYFENQPPGTPDLRELAALLGIRKGWDFDSLAADLVAHPPPPDELPSILKARDYLKAWFPQVMDDIEHVRATGGAEPSGGQGVILCGVPGTRKTSLMISTLRAAARRTPKKGTFANGKWWFSTGRNNTPPWTFLDEFVMGIRERTRVPPAPVWYESMRGLSEKLETERFRTKRDPDAEYDEEPRPYKSQLDDVSLLGLDDADKFLDSHRATRRELAILEHLTARVEGEGVPLNLIITTNIRPQEWPSAFSDSLADRWAKFECFHFRGASRRKFFHPADPPEEV
jgi:hypothetical protein